MFRRRPPRLTRQQQLSAKPLRLVDGVMADAADGGGRLTVPLRQRRWAGWLLRVPPGATKTFELDALGRMVWDACDGRTTVQQIGRRLAKRYRLSDREAQVSTEAFLATLARRGLVGGGGGEEKCKVRNAKCRMKRQSAGRLSSSFCNLHSALCTCAAKVHPW